MCVHTHKHVIRITELHPKEKVSISDDPKPLVRDFKCGKLRCFISHGNIHIPPSLTGQILHFCFTCPRAGYSEEPVSHFTGGKGIKDR